MSSTGAGSQGARYEGSGAPAADVSVADLPERGGPAELAERLESLTAGYSRELVFWLNGAEIRLSDVDPDALLVDYLRSPEVGLTGTKLVCGQGGCGACTVTLSGFDPQACRVVHRDVNSCLRRLASLDGLAVTTVEGLEVDGRMSPIQYRISKENGSQCGYCTPGFVMSLHSLLVNSTDGGLEQPSMADIERHFAGNICRCTGYRPILHALHRFGRDWHESAEDGVLECIPLPGDETDHYAEPASLVPDGLPTKFRPVAFRRDDRWWIRPESLDDIPHIQTACAGWARVELANGGTAIQLRSVWGSPREAERRVLVYVDISRLEELRTSRLEPDHLRIGAGLSYTDALHAIENAIEQLDERESRLLEAIHLAGLRTAGSQVRNAGTWAGNTILCAELGHTGFRFASDMVTALAAAGAVVTVASSHSDTVRPFGMLELLDAWEREALNEQGLILSYEIPHSTDREFVMTDRVAIRKEDATAIVNCGMRVRFDDDWRVEDATFVFGGIGILPFRANLTEAAVTGRTWDDAALQDALGALLEDIRSIRAKQASELSALPEDVVSSEYRTQLAQSFLYRFFVSVGLDLPSAAVAPQVAAAGKPYNRSLSGGRQIVPDRHPDGVVGAPFLKEGAFRQATGHALYTQDIPLPADGVHGAFVTAERALSRFCHRVPDDSAPEDLADGTAAVRAYLGRFEGFVDYLGAEDLPHPAPKPANSPFYDPLLAKDLVTCWGQPVGLVLAETERQALELARRIQRYCLAYEPLLGDDGKPLEPLLSIEEARERPDGAMPDSPPFPVHIAAIERPGTDRSWAEASGDVTIDGVACTVVRGSMATGLQAQFYLETQACVAVPGENDHLEIHSSSQWPRGVHDGAATALGLPSNAISVRMRRLGGGYGGKTSRTPFVSSPAAIAAHRLGRPVRLALPRDTDTVMIGKRHPFLGEFCVAIGNGRDDPANRGRMMGLVTDFFSDGGNTYDCSLIVMDCAQLQCDGPYNIGNYRTTGTICRTNTASNNAMRSYGVIQATLIQEEALEAACHAVGALPEDARKLSLYELGDETPTGQVLDSCYLGDIWSRLESQAGFNDRLEQACQFNADNRWRKRGISMMPLKYGLGFYAAFLEQGGGLVDVYRADGTVLLRHGGVEMGQGLWTRVTQIAAHALNVPIDLIRTADTNTSVITDPISTGGSTGTMLNGGAVREACWRLRARLEAFVDDMRAQHDDDWCRKHGINVWEEAEGWRALVGKGTEQKLMWRNVVDMAFNERVQLSELVRYKTEKNPFPHGIHFNPGVKEEVDQFDSYTYAAACTDVEVNVLTGETEVLRSDILYDMGRSLNPALDVGQIEGAFVQGLGHILTERMVFENAGDARGRLNTLNVMDYKPPGPLSIPIQLNVDLFPRTESDPPIHHVFDAAGAKASAPPLTSKGVGEPPLVLAATAYFAVKHAILAARRDRGHEEWFRLDTPATVDRIREACLVEPADLLLIPKPSASAGLSTGTARGCR